jgi:hypothetical protein
LENSCIPGNPLGPGDPGEPGGPIGPGGPGVRVDSRTAVVSAKTFRRKMVCDKNLHKKDTIKGCDSKTCSVHFSHTDLVNLLNSVSFKTLCMPKHRSVFV